MRVLLGGSCDESRCDQSAKTPSDVQKAKSVFFVGAHISALAVLRVIVAVVSFLVFCETAGSHFDPGM